MSKRKRSNHKEKKEIRKSSPIKNALIIILLLTILVIIAHLFSPPTDHFPKISWEEPVEIQVIATTDLVKDIRQIMINYALDLEKAIDQKSEALCNLAFQNFYLKMIDIAQKNGWTKYAQEMRQGRSTEFCHFLSNELEKYGWHFSTVERQWGFDWGNFKVENCRLGQIVKIQSGKIGEIEFQLITLKEWKTISPENLAASTGHGKIILLQNFLKEEFTKQQIETDFNKYVDYITLHELQHIYDQGTYTVSQSDSPILEARAVLRTLVDPKVNPKLVITDIGEWPTSTHSVYHEAYQLIFHYLGTDPETIQTLSPKEIRQKAHKAFEMTTVVMEKLSKGD